MTQKTAKMVAFSTIVLAVVGLVVLVNAGARAVTAPKATTIPEDQQTMPGAGAVDVRKGAMPVKKVNNLTTSIAGLGEKLVQSAANGFKKPAPVKHVQVDGWV